MSRTSSPTRHRTPWSGWSTGCWPRRDSASGGLGTGWTSSATATRSATRPTCRSRTPGGIAITSSAPSTPTCPTIGSSWNTSRATCSTTPVVVPDGGDNESVIGTSFFWMSEGKRSPVDLRQALADTFDNRIDVMSKAFLGLTVACARCHDHKFDADHAGRLLRPRWIPEEFSLHPGDAQPGGDRRPGGSIGGDSGGDRPGGRRGVGDSSRDDPPLPHGRPPRPFG